MIELEDSVYIDVPPTRIWEWLSDLPHHYREWHPAHVKCQYLRSDHLCPGAVLGVEEYLHGKLHKLKLRATTVEPNHLLRYTSHGFLGSFELTPQNSGTVFTARLAFGMRIPILRTVIDAILRRMLRSRLNGFRVHMREEGQNLKQLIESGPAV